MNEEVLKRIRELIAAKKPELSKKNSDNQVNICVDGIREMVRDIPGVIKLIRDLIANPTYRFRADSFIAEVRKNQGINKPDRAEYSDFAAYKKAWVYITFVLSGEEPPNKERISVEVDNFSQSLANERLIDYKGPDGRECKRHLTRAEYEEIARERQAAGTGQLLLYNEVKYLTENLTQTPGNSTRIVDSVTEKWYNKEPEYEVNF